MPARAWVPAIAAGMIVLSAGTGRAQPYRDPAHHFTVTPPPGWTQVSAQALAAANGMIRSRGLGQVQYLAGFQRKGRPPLEYPYVLVQFHPAPNDGMTYDDIEAELGRAGKAMDEAVEQVKGKVSDLGTNVAVSRPTIDRAT